MRAQALFFGSNIDDQDVEVTSGHLLAAVLRRRVAVCHRPCAVLAVRRRDAIWRSKRWTKHKTLRCLPFLTATWLWPAPRVCNLAFDSSRVGLTYRCRSVVSLALFIVGCDHQVGAAQRWRLVARLADRSGVAGNIRRSGVYRFRYRLIGPAKSGGGPRPAVWWMAAPSAATKPPVTSKIARCLNLLLSCFMLTIMQ